MGIGVFMKNRPVAGIFLAFLFVSFAFSQSKTTGALSGVITDASASYVPGAKVTATNSDTGASMEAASDDRGEYRFPLLPPGVYELKIEKSGFAVASRKGIGITVGQTAVVDAKLSLSSETQQVEV